MGWLYLHPTLYSDSLEANEKMQLLVSFGFVVMVFIVTFFFFGVILALEFQGQRGYYEERIVDCRVLEGNEKRVSVN